MPIFSRMAASRTLPTVGASVWASGSQVWNGHIGTLMAKPMPMARKTRFWMPDGRFGPDAWSRRTSKVWGLDRKYRARKPSSMKTLPNRV